MAESGVKFGSWDEEALKFIPQVPLSSVVSTSEPSLASSYSSFGASVTSSSLSSDLSLTGSWDGNAWFGRLQSLETSAVPLPEFNASFGGRTVHERRTTSGWLNPNISSARKKIFRRSSYILETGREEDDRGSVPDIEITNWNENELDLIKENGQSPPRPTRLDIGHRSNISVETLSTPEISGIRSSTWSKSPTRSFVRNFP